MDKIVCITGANRGLGSALAMEYLKTGCTVVSLSRKAPKITVTSGTLAHFKMDVADEKSVRAAAQKVGEKFSKVDIFINNAAIYPMAEPIDQDLEKLTSADLKNIVEMARINSFGPVLAVKYFIPLLRKGMDKLVVNISSEAGSIGQSGRKAEFGYCMSKAALNMAVKIMHNRYKTEGFRVFAVQPGWMRTDMGGPNASLAPEESAQSIVKTVAARKTITEDIFFDKDGNKLEW